MNNTKENLFSGKFSENSEGIYSQLLLYGNEQGDEYALEAASRMLNNLEELMEVCNPGERQGLILTFSQVREATQFLHLRSKARGEKKFSRGDLVTDEDSCLYMVEDYKAVVRKIGGNFEASIIYDVVCMRTKRKEKVLEKNIGRFCSEEFLNSVKYR